MGKLSGNIQAWMVTLFYQPFQSNGCQQNGALGDSPSSHLGSASSISMIKIYTQTDQVFSFSARASSSRAKCSSATCCEPSRPVLSVFPLGSPYGNSYVSRLISASLTENHLAA